MLLVPRIVLGKKIDHSAQVCIAGVCGQLYPQPPRRSSAASDARRTLDDIRVAVKSIQVVSTARGDASFRPKRPKLQAQLSPQVGTETISQNSRDSAQSHLQR